MLRCVVLALSLVDIVAAPGHAESSVSGTINLHEYGAKCDGVADDTAAIQAALAKASAAGYGATVQSPAGRCLVHAALLLTIPAAGVVIHGEGPGVSAWVWTQDTDGIDATFASAGWWVRNNSNGQSGVSLTITGLALVNDNPSEGGNGRGTAIKVMGDNVTGRPPPGTAFEHLTITGFTADQRWGNGIYAHDVGSIVFRDIVWTGHSQLYQGTGIEIAGVAQSNEAVNHMVDGFHATFAGTALKVDDGVQGVIVSNSFLNNVDTSIEWVVPAGGPPEDSLFVSNTQMNYNKYGVRAANVDDVILRGNYFLAGVGTTTAVAITNGGFFVMNGNTLRGASGLETGVFLDDDTSVPLQYGSAITGNVFGNLGHGAAGGGMRFGSGFKQPIAVGGNQFSATVPYQPGTKPPAVAMLSNEIDAATVTGDVGSATIIQGIGTIPLGHLTDADIAATAVTTGFRISEPSFRSGELLKCSGTLASGSITVPPRPRDHSQYTLASQCDVASLSIISSDGSGFAKAANPSRITAGSSLTVLYDAGGNAWYRWH